MGNSLVVQWLGLGTAVGPGSIPGQGTTRSHKTRSMARKKKSMECELNPNKNAGWTSGSGAGETYDLIQGFSRFSVP